MKTNVSIKFNSIEEYREIEKKLEELGYVNDELSSIDINECKELKIFKDRTFCHFPFIITHVNKTYNSLEEFLKD